MRIANLSGRSVLINSAGRAIDVSDASGGKFGPDPQSLFVDWDAFVDWASHQSDRPGRAFDTVDLGPVTPRPRQIFAIGLNYGEHAAESGFNRPDRMPPTFTKFASCLTGPTGQIELPAGGNTDWEIELVVVIKDDVRRACVADGWTHVAGLTVGQDLSERDRQLAGPAPQFGLAKSFSKFGPIGPWMVTLDEIGDPDDLELGCSIDGEEVQRGRTKDLLFTVPKLIAGLSAVVTLYAGDLIFTGTPSGVGQGRQPQRFLQPGEELVSYISQIGEMRHTFVAGQRG